MKLSVRGLRKTFGEHSVLDGIDLDVAPGEVVALLGRNGAGKSTLLSCIAGTVISDAGTIVIDGISLHEQPLPARRRLRYLPQESEFPEGLTGSEALGFFADVFAASSQAQTEPGALEQRTGLPPESLQRLISTYSVGMRRRLGFASLFAGDGQLFVLDEPFAGIDKDAFAAMLSALGELKQRGAGILLAMHEQEVELITARLQPRFLRVENGRFDAQA